MASLHYACTSFSSKFNGALNSFKTFISSEQQQRISTSRNANLIFIISCLLNIVQVKYQGNSEASPFQTHPKTCNVAVIGVLMYGLAHDAQQRLSETHPNCANAAGRAMTLFGSLVTASLASILLPGWVQLILYIMCILYCADELIDWLLRRFVGEVEDIDTLPV